MSMIFSMTWFGMNISDFEYSISQAMQQPARRAVEY